MRNTPLLTALTALAVVVTLGCDVESWDPDPQPGQIDNAAAASDDLVHTKPYSKCSVLATAGVPLDTTSMELLRLEHETLRTQRSVLDMIQRSLAVFGMYAALFALCGGFAVYRVPRLTASLARLAGMLALVAVTVSLCTVLAPLEWQAELIPLLLFSMTVTIVYQQDLALLLSAAVILVVVVAIGAALPGVMIFFSATAAAIRKGSGLTPSWSAIWTAIGAVTTAVAVLFNRSDSVITAAISNVKITAGDAPAAMVRMPFAISAVPPL